MWTDDLRVLRSLVAVVDTGSVARAARVTGYSATAVSRHISGLEAELELPLFERTGRSLRPSTIARMTADRARLVIEEAEILRSSVQAMSRGEAGMIRFGYFRAAATTLIPPVLAEMREHHPNVRVSLRECAVGEEITDLLRGGELDAGFVWGHTQPDTDGLVVEPIVSDALLLLTALDREDLHETPRDLSRLVGEPFSSHPAKTVGSPPIVDDLFLSQGLPAPTVTHWLTDHASAKAYIAAGLVVALIPALGVSDASPGVRRSIVVDDFRRVYLARPQGRPHPLSGVFDAAVRRAAHDYRGTGVRYIGRAP